MKRPLVPKMVVVILVVIAIVIAGLWAYQVYDENKPGRFGQNLEIRLLAVDDSKVNDKTALLLDGPISGKDVFPGSEAGGLNKTGDAPPGWRWLPVTHSLDTIASLKSVAVYRDRLTGLEVLVGDEPESALIHGTNGPAWGVKAARVEQTAGLPGESETNYCVDVTLDAAGARLLQALSSRYLHHYLAVVVGGQVVMAPRVSSPVAGSFEISLGLRDPVNQQRQAERLQRQLTGWTEIHEAARDGDVQKVNALLKARPDLVFRKDDEFGRTALHWAASNDRKEVAQLLLAKGADVGAKDDDGDTPLHWAAASRGNKGMVEFLLANGADANATNNQGDSALHYAAEFGHDPEIAALLLGKGAMVNAMSSAGETPLHWAAGMRDKDMIQVLLAGKADVNARDNNNETPLHVAAAVGQVDTVQVLLNNHAEVNAKDKEGKTPLSYAVLKGNEAVAELLRRYGGQD